MYNSISAPRFITHGELFPFRFSDGDFTGLGAFRDDLYLNPQYVHSPYGSWLAVSNNPAADSFSQWFRSESNRNIHYEEKLELGLQLETDAKGNPVFRHFNDEFFPVDGRGWGAEGQRDCFSNALRNYGYVSSNVSNTRKFHWDIQTPRRELKYDVQRSIFEKIQPEVFG